MGVPIKLTPIYVDGPLKGSSEHEIFYNALSTGINVAVPFQGDKDKGLLAGTMQVFELPKTVRYRFFRFVLLGHVLWIGSIKLRIEEVATEDMLELFDTLITDRGKQATDQRKGPTWRPPHPT